MVCVVPELAVVSVTIHSSISPLINIDCRQLEIWNFIVIEQALENLLSTNEVVRESNSLVASTV